MKGPIKCANSWHEQSRRKVEQEEHRMRMMLKSKIHRATVTEANVDYEGESVGPVFDRTRPPSPGDRPGGQQSMEVRRTWVRIDGSS